MVFLYRGPEREQLAYKFEKLLTPDDLFLK